MPELPDVETYKRYMDSTSLHKTIERTSVTDDRVLEDISPRGLARRLKGRRFEDTDRRGKFLFARLSGGGWLVLHFGMTGELRYYKEESDRPEHARVILDFANGYHLAYVSQRMLGLVNFARDLESYIESQDLGPDALNSEMDSNDFAGILEGHRGKIKPTLMNQSLIAGIGNIYADEILFQAGIHPRTSMDELDKKDISRLFRTMRRVLRVTSEKGARVDEMPRGYLLPNREEEGKCPRCGGKIEKITVSGRSAYYCPRCQGRV